MMDKLLIIAVNSEKKSYFDNYSKQPFFQAI